MQEDWRHDAVCRDEDPELFFPVGNSGPALQQVAEAKAVCARCPVAAQCLSWALEAGQDAGVWGGMNEDERRQVARQRGPHRRGASWENSADSVAVERAVRGRGISARELRTADRLAVVHQLMLAEPTGASNRTRAARALGAPGWKVDEYLDQLQGASDEPTTTT